MWATIRTMLPSTGSAFPTTTAGEPGRARDAAEAAARAGTDVVVAIGGDGTLNEALNGLMMVAEPDRPAIAFVPGGTANILARALGLPTSVRGVGEVLKSGVRRRIDVGRVNGRYFATIAGIGFDAEVVASAIPLRRWMAGKPAHAAAVLRTLMTYRATTVRLRIDGVEHILPLTFLAAANTDWYGGGLHIAPGAQADDGRFLIVCGTALTRLETLDVMRRAFSGRHLRHPKVSHYPAAVVTAEGDRPLALHADGEWLGRWPSLRFDIIPGALHVIVPRSGTTGDEGRT